MEIIYSWIKANIELLFMGLSGAIIGALVSDKPLKDKFVSFVVGFLLACSLSPYIAEWFSNGKYIGGYGFILGMGGITIARMIRTAIDNRAKSEIESKTGVKLDDEPN